MSTHSITDAPVTCIFCQIGKGEIDSKVLYRNSDIFAINDINPRAPTHILIIPIEHLEFTTIDKDILLDILGRMSLLARKLAKENNIKKEGYRIAINQGHNAGQTVKHLHMHLIGGKQLGPEG